ncbi:MAG: hypothetical protein ACP5O8_01115 [Candidatus Aenigmatarchaeota archaeon]
MVSVLFMIFGIIDLLGGIALTFGTVSFLPQISRYIGLFLIAKGLWTLITSIIY